MPRLARYKIIERVQSSSTVRKTFLMFKNNKIPSVVAGNMEKVYSPKRQHRESIQGTSREMEQM